MVMVNYIKNCYRVSMLSAKLKMDRQSLISPLCAPNTRTPTSKMKRCEQVFSNSLKQESPKWVPTQISTNTKKSSCQFPIKRIKLKQLGWRVPQVFRWIYRPWMSDQIKHWITLLEVRSLRSIWPQMMRVTMMKHNQSFTLTQWISLNSISVL